jgi:hypothetical protein
MRLWELRGTDPSEVFGTKKQNNIPTASHLPSPAQVGSLRSVPVPKSFNLHALNFSASDRENRPL